MLAFLFSSWVTLGEIALTALLIYITLIAVLRFSGKRTLAKFNAFDFVVTVALGSMVANTILNDQTTVADGAVGIGILVLAQMLVTFSVTRSRRVQEVVKSVPRLLFFKGSFQQDALVSERVSTEEVRRAVRDAGHGRMDQVLAVILESNGTISVIGADGQDPPLDALVNVNAGETDLRAGERLPPTATWEEGTRPPGSVASGPE